MLSCFNRPVQPDVTGGLLSRPKMLRGSSEGWVLVDLGTKAAVGTKVGMLVGTMDGK